MPTDVIKTIGQTGSPITPDFSTLQSWEDASPTDLTTSRSNTTVTGATSSTIILDLGASGTNDFYVGHPVWCDARPTEKRMIVAYNGTTKIATIAAFNGSNATWDNTPLIEAYTVDSVRYIGRCLDQGTFNARVTIAGQTIDATHPVILDCAAGASFGDKAAVRSTALRYNESNGVAIYATGVVAAQIRVETDYTVVRGVQVRDGGSYGGLQAIMIVAANCLVDRVIAYTSQANAPVSITFASSKLVNSLVQMDQAPTAFCSQHFGSHYGCTLINTGTPGGTCFQSEYGASLAKNCVIIGFSTFSGSAMAAGSDYNATDLASASTGSHNLTSLTAANQFENVANDFRAVDTGSLDLNGTPDATNTPIDISGTTRDAVAPTIGCWEIIVSADNSSSSSASSLSSSSSSSVSSNSSSSLSSQSSSSSSSLSSQSSSSSSSVSSQSSASSESSSSTSSLSSQSSSSSSSVSSLSSSSSSSVSSASSSSSSSVSSQSSSSTSSLSSLSSSSSRSEESSSSSSVSSQSSSSLSSVSSASSASSLSSQSSSLSSASSLSSSSSSPSSASSQSSSSSSQSSASSASSSSSSVSSASSVSSSSQSSASSVAAQNLVYPAYGVAAAGRSASASAGRYAVSHQATGR